MDEPSATRGLAHRLDDVSTRGAFWVGVVTTAAVLIMMFGLAAWVSRSEPNRLQWQTATAIVGDQEVSIPVDGAFVGASDGVPLWYDATGAQHTGGWPSCLGPVGSAVTFRFATVQVVVPEGEGQTPIVAVDCRRP